MQEAEPRTVADESATKRSHVFGWIGLICRLALGIVLVVAGGIKLPALEQSVLAVRGYQILPYELAVFVGYALPMIEVLVGVLLIIGLFTRWASLIGGLLMLAFIIGISQAWARGISIDCGCFGGGGEVAWDVAVRGYILDLIRDVALLLAAAWGVWRPHSKLGLDAKLFGDDDMFDYADDELA